MQYFIVAEYYVGPLHRYDGGSCTDVAHLWLCSTREKAIEKIFQEIERNIVELEDPQLDGNEIDQLTNSLNQFGQCTYRNCYMYTLGTYTLES